MRTNLKTCHEQALEFLLVRPKDLGLTEKVEWSAREVQVYKSNGVQLETDIDLLWAFHNGIWIAEYKCGYNSKGEARYQLGIGKRFVEQKWGVTPVTWYISGPAYHQEELKI